MYFCVNKMSSPYSYNPLKTNSSFGSVMDKRTYTALNTDYKYGFNGMERDDEVAGAGNSYTAEFWQYDGRLGRRFNVDPKPVISISVYACFMNNPIGITDVAGDTSKFVNKSGKVLYTAYDGTKNATYVITGSMLKNGFVKELSKRVSNDEDLSFEKNKNLGEKYGYNLEDRYNARKLYSRATDDEWQIGYKYGYRGGIWNYFVMLSRDGQDGGKATAGEVQGKQDKKNGEMDIISPKLKGGNDVLVARKYIKAVEKIIMVKEIDSDGQVIWVEKSIVTFVTIRKLESNEKKKSK